MTTTITPAERYRSAAHTLTDRITAVPDDAWTAPSPCEGWTVRDVVAHLVETERDIVRHVDLELPHDPDPATDPVGAWLATRNAMQAILDDPELGSREYDGHFGRTNLAATIETFYCFDLLVHGWDIARGAGIDDRIETSDLEWLDSLRPVMGEAIRYDGVCGPEVPVAADADLQTRVLAYLGRRS
ncbi:TIGR03086 family protein [Rhodococcus rhodnii]|uniref:Mycothiol-dependent maleylpyruvate isomerase metal-binding domain-containing protein n=2 Tax=Rhodococcus rhodnii TaxID=38312 RepID=R7WTS3_9NOCA|nr:TIGR03086 family metal-binding protein [Rhodococcus rhodnii]EOM77549.1 hypothetical protein Rrhod_1092 [Rhodococcus rhodnii LMG 5362]TXG89405.1 TIGR03086 family protein [Rhodococcus rhodnii]